MVVFFHGQQIPRLMGVLQDLAGRRNFLKVLGTRENECGMTQDEREGCDGFEEPPGVLVAETAPDRQEDYAGALAVFKKEMLSALGPTAQNGFENQRTVAVHSAEIEQIKIATSETVHGDEPAKGGNGAAEMGPP